MKPGFVARCICEKFRSKTINCTFDKRGNTDKERWYNRDNEIMKNLRICFTSENVSDGIQVPQFMLNEMFLSMKARLHFDSIIFFTSLLT